MVVSLPGTEKIDLLSLLPQELETLLCEAGMEKYRAKQVFLRLHRYQDTGVDGFTELPKVKREQLGAIGGIPQIEIAQKQVSRLDGTAKYLFRLMDGSLVESVLMRYRHGNTLCVSTQVGCRMGCAFCASGLNGLARNLTAGEILLQVATATKDSGERVDGVVMMGTGEPLDNYQASVDFIRLVGAENGLGIGQRHISLSTSGLVPKIQELATLHLGITLSVSLHAAYNQLRTQLMPINKKYPVEELVRAATAYQKETGRRVSYEYAMIRDVNDTEQDVAYLTGLLRNSGAHLNLIRLNEIAESPFHPTRPEQLQRFMALLEKNGIHVTLRRRLGTDIDGACGQLRRRFDRE